MSEPHELEDGAHLSRPGPAPSMPTPPRGERKLDCLLGILADFVFILRKDGVILRARCPENGEISATRSQLEGKKLMDLLPGPIGQKATFYLEKAFRTGRPESFAGQFLVADQLRDFEGRILAWEPGEAVAVVRDVTDRRSLQKEILEISQRERTRIGQDLHDGLGQHLTGITFLTKALQNKLQNRQLPEAVEAAEIGKLVMQALSQTRNLARGLFPVELERNGLVSALKELSETTEQLFRIRCVLEHESGVDIGPGMAATHLFRLAQEAISNSVKHGKAKSVVIRLGQTEDQYWLEVADDGSGISSAAAGARGLGLRIMNYRAQKLLGHLEVAGPPDEKGTVVRCRFPAPRPGA